MEGIVHGMMALLVSGLLGQEKPRDSVRADGDPPAQREPSGRTALWSEGVSIPVRVPVATPMREFMTTLAFPEDSIETAITGWGEGDITAVQKRGLLFLKLARKTEGLLGVIGGSGTHYLLYLKGIENPEPDAFDAYVKIRKKDEARPSDALPKRQHPRPSGALEVLQSMRMGLHPEGFKILRARRELAYESRTLEVRLLYVFDGQSYCGLVYELKNTSLERQSVDASRLRGKGTGLILTALRENVLEPQATTRLYAVTWKD
jgi:hypothetical protein